MGQGVSGYLSRPQSEWTLARAFEASLDRWPDTPFTDFIGHPAGTRSQLHGRALAIAGGLKGIGLEPGQFAAILAPASPDVIAAWIGINFAGAVEVNVNDACKGATLAHALSTAEISVAFVATRHLMAISLIEAELPALRHVIHMPDHSGAEIPRFRSLPLVELAEIEAAPARAAPVRAAHTDLASIIYTSGTSGPAKAVRMPFAQTYFLAARTIDKLEMEPSDRFYCVHPLYHMAGKFMGVQAMLMSGGAVCIRHRFDAARWLDEIRDAAATVTLAHGPMLQAIAAALPAGADCRSTLERMITVPRPKSLPEEFERRLGIRSIECWGMTEINAVSWSSLSADPIGAGAGKIDADYYEFGVFDPLTDEPVPAGQIGEFVVRPKLPFIIMQGYHRMPDQTVEATRNLWFHTGDAGRVDEAGNLHFVDRLGDRIRRRAENISSFDIESAARAYPDMKDCAAVAVPSEFEGDDDIKLFVVLHEHSDLRHEELLVFLLSRLPHFMVPRYVERIAALPRTPTQKVQKAQLRKAPHGPACYDRKASGGSLRDLAARADRQAPPNTSSQHD